MWDEMLERLLDLFNAAPHIDDEQWNEFAAMIKKCCYYISLRDGVSIESVEERISGVEGCGEW